MKFLLDQNAERRIAPFLRNLGHDVKVVAVDFPPDIPDHEVLAYAYKEQRILITNDKGDFGELIFKDFHPHAGVILLGAPAASAGKFTVSPLAPRMHSSDF